MAQGDRLAKELSSEDWYHGLLPREDMNTLLRRNGDFLVRYSEAKKGQDKSFIISVMRTEQLDKDGIKHYIINRNPQGKFLVEKFAFPTVKAMILHHLKNRDSLVTTDNGVTLLTPIKRQDWEHSHEDVQITRKLGEGAFGEVSLGRLKIHRGPQAGKTVDVAVKMAKLEQMTKDQLKEIMCEARLMRRFNHPNVVKFYGVATLMEPLMVIMELAGDGALDSYLKKTPQSQEKLNEMVLQAAYGLNYIHSKNVLHRDLAARNCLYGGGNVKIADFGLSREGNCYQMDPHSRVPIRWLAPECIATAIFTHKTDVWAFGVMAWEIYSGGIEPYPGMMVAEVAQSVRQGYRMDFPSGVKGDVANFFKTVVWNEDPIQRPTMSDVVRLLPPLLQVNSKH